MATEYMSSKDRKEMILNAAITVAERDSYITMKRVDISAQADCAESLINKYFGTMGQLRRAVMRHAIKNRNFKIVAQGLSNNDSNARKAPEDLKREASQILMG